MTKDIENIEDIRLLVGEFYGRVREDVLLGPIFEGIIQDRWEEHLEKMYRFWQTVLLDEHTYYGTPFPPHATMPVNMYHFQRWIEIFCSTVDSLFAGEIADKAKLQGERMASIFQSKIAYLQQNNL
jgi:hemoglobin